MMYGEVAWCMKHGHDWFERGKGTLINGHKFTDYRCSVCGARQRKITE